MTDSHKTYENNFALALAGLVHLCLAMTALSYIVRTCLLFTETNLSDLSISSPSALGGFANYHSLLSLSGMFLPWSTYHAIKIDWPFSHGHFMTAEGFALGPWRQSRPWIVNGFRKVVYQPTLREPFALTAPRNMYVYPTILLSLTLLYLPGGKIILTNTNVTSITLDRSAWLNHALCN